MKKIGEYIVNRKQVCRITDIKTIKGVIYYSLEPLEDPTLKLVVPVDSDLLRDIISKEKALELINIMPNIEIIENDDRVIENEYKKLMNNGTHEDLIKIIKTSYLRNKERMDHNRKTSEKDTEYFNQAEKYLYNELAVALEMDIEETKDYIKNALNGLTI